MRVALVLLAACSYSPSAAVDGTTGDDAPSVTDAQPDGSDGPPIAWLHPWAHRKAITIHGNLVDGTLADFPVLIAAADPQIAAAAQAGGADIRFTAADATTLVPSEIESLAGNQLVAWVKQSLVAGTDVTLYAYYGHPATPAAVDRSTVWTADFRGVWHFNQDPGSTSTIEDSTATHLDGTATALQAADRVAAQFGLGYQFDGSTKFVNFGTTNLGQTFSISMWVSFPTATSVKTLFSNSAQGTNTDGVRFFINNNAQTDRRLIIETGDGGNSGTTQTGNNAIPVDTFTHVAVTVNRGAGTAKLYIGGELVTSGNVRNNFKNDSDFEVARMEGTLYFPGKIDEVELATVERPLSWLRTTFRNQDSPGTFVTFGSQEDEP